MQTSTDNFEAPKNNPWTFPDILVHPLKSVSLVQNSTFWPIQLKNLQPRSGRGRTQPIEKAGSTQHIKIQN